MGRPDVRSPASPRDRVDVRHIETTVGELRVKGAQFRGPVEEREYGRVIMMIVPGADDIQLYQPTHKLAYKLEDTGTHLVG